MGKVRPAEHWMVWRKGPAVVEVGTIKLEGRETYNPYDHYQPSMDGSKLYLEFISINEEAEESVLGFVRQYGVLGLERRKWPAQREEALQREVDRLRWSHARMSTALPDILRHVVTAFSNPAEASEQPDQETSRAAWEEAWAISAMSLEEWEAQQKRVREEGSRDAMTKAMRLALSPSYVPQDVEDLDEFRREVRNMRTLVHLWRACKELDEQRLRSLVRVLWVDPLPESLREEQAKQVEEASVWRLLWIARTELESRVNDQLGTRVFPRLTFSEGEPQQTWTATDLLAAMYHMMALDLSGPFPARQCENQTCRRFFIPTRAAKAYCSPECGSAQRIREYRSRKKSGTPTE